MREKEDLLKMYDEIAEVNKILCIPSKEWTEDQRILVQKHTNHHSNPYYYPGYEELGCSHNWQIKFLLTSAYKQCTLCGEEADHDPDKDGYPS